ncbi:LacI family DNA-binding transcriptional regulator [Metabacillus iocasae]|uniref:LacI family transcriptional regulator n=1 Tax=Priestia iocasae TaxID=2291674 RepID=A0ABS2QZJ0_9BACI|nr:LacI family DNA-binding transcriptional regulator [Metabacillus iocasae]MBM7704613.1 LacI family transcriptional regulator [Metabacillus iocasae]
MSVTIKDVAKQANVSVATVSRILNNLPGYSEETKQKVVKVIDELGYQPNAIARGLISKKTNTMGVLLPKVSDLFASEILAGIEDVAHEFDHSVIICKTDKDGTRTMKYLQTLREKQVDGIIIVSEYITKEYYDMLTRMNIPVVLVATQSNYDIPCIKVDDFKASYEAVTYLLDKGHIHIGMISGTRSDKMTTTPRVHGYRQALIDSGLPFTENAVAYGDFGFQSGIECMQQLLSHQKHLTAVFCASDEMAIGALSYLYKQGIKVPEQISLLGYDNTATAQKAIPPLTTIEQPLYKMGRRAFEVLIKGERKVNLIYPHRIIERDTVTNREPIALLNK